ncbi:MAG TPA: trypsin-like peptidase domain-containing protein [Vicinamibacteria bacterium]|nr:trypsin-like peptidase domain-containing protein [Vicinamibacteria bacterium]
MRVETTVVLTALLAASAAFASSRAPRDQPAVDAFETMSRSFERIAAEVSPSVVQIFTSGYGLGPQHGEVLTKQEGTASGIVVDAGGLIVTNAHVVSGVGRITVQLAPPADPAHPGRPLLRAARPKLEAKVVGVDTVTDLALLRVAADDLPALRLADSDKLRQGQLVLAFGSPLGLGNTVTMGVVSAVTRQLGPDETLAYIQTDAPINPGNSGGPLVDSNGEVVGLNTMILTQSGGSEGVGLAIPSNTVRSVVEQLRRHGHVHRGVIGVQVQTVTPTMVTALGLPHRYGVIVADVDPNGPAAKAGLQIGDVVLSANLRPVENVRQFSSSLYRIAVDATVDLEVQRGEELLTIRASVIERPDDPSRFLEMVRPETNLVPQLDLLGIDLDPSLVEALRTLRNSTGVLVAAMSTQAAPPGDRFQPGDVIHAVNGVSVDSLSELKRAVKDMKDGDPIVVQIERDGVFRYVAFEID